MLKSQVRLWYRSAYGIKSKKQRGYDEQKKAEFQRPAMKIAAYFS